MLGMKTRKKSAMLLLTAVMSISLFGCSTGNSTTGNAAQPAGEGNTAAAAEQRNRLVASWSCTVLAHRSWRITS